LIFHGEDTVDISAVRLWMRNSWNIGGNLELNIQLRSGRPVTAHHYVNSQTFDELIKKKKKSMNFSYSHSGKGKHRFT